MNTYIREIKRFIPESKTEGIISRNNAYEFFTKLRDGDADATRVIFQEFTQVKRSLRDGEEIIDSMNTGVPLASITLGSGPITFALSSVGGDTVGWNIYFYISSPYPEEPKKGGGIILERHDCVIEVFIPIGSSRYIDRGIPDVEAFITAAQAGDFQTTELIKRFILEDRKQLIRNRIDPKYLRYLDFDNGFNNSVVTHPLIPRSGRDPGIDLGEFTVSIFSQTKPDYSEGGRESFVILTKIEYWKEKIIK